MKKVLAALLIVFALMFASCAESKPETVNLTMDNYTDYIFVKLESISTNSTIIESRVFYGAKENFYFKDVIIKYHIDAKVSEIKLTLGGQGQIIIKGNAFDIISISGQVEIRS